MKTLTREIAQEIALETTTVEEFIARLEEESFIRTPPRLSLGKVELRNLLSKTEREITDDNSPYMLNRLVEAGYLRREKDDGAINIGRKPYIYRLTPKAYALLDGIELEKPSAPATPPASVAKIPLPEELSNRDIAAILETGADAINDTYLEASLQRFVASGHLAEGVDGFTITKKGDNLVRLSKSWKKPAAKKETVGA